MKGYFKPVGFIFLFFLSTFYLATCSGGGGGGTSSTANTGTATITADGGSVTSKDGKLTLTFPAGAVSGSVEVSATKKESDDDYFYELLPDGQQFLKPVTATFKFSASEIGEVKDEEGNVIDPNSLTPVMPFFLISSDGTVEILDNVSASNNDGEITVTAELTHFSSTYFGVGGTVFFYTYPSSISANVGKEFKIQLKASALTLGRTATIIFSFPPRPSFEYKYTLKSMGITKIIVSSESPVAVVSPRELTKNDLFTSPGSYPITTSTFVCDDPGEGEAIFTINGYLGVEIDGSYKQYSFDNKAKSDVECVGLLSGLLSGCTDPEATNYLPEANVDDMSCEYALDVETIIGSYSGRGTLAGNTCGSQPNAGGTFVPTITYENGGLYWNSNARIPLSYDPETGYVEGSGVYTDSNGNEVTESVKGTFSRDANGNLVFKGKLGFASGGCGFEYDLDLTKQ